MLTFNNFSLRRGQKLLLDSVNLIIKPKQRVGIVGKNGCGKSSLFSLIRGTLAPDQGTLAIPSGCQIAFLEQETPALEQSAIDYVIDGDAQYRQLENLLKIAEEKQDGMAVAKYHEKLHDIDGYSIQARASIILAGLGFSKDEPDRAVKTFSGGWRMRLNLAKTLIARADLLLLDEPTNHLDLDALIWLEQWLKIFAGTLILISHDRDFLDAVTSHIIHFDQQQLKIYTGNYSSFEIQRANALALQQSSFEKQQRERAHLQKFVDRFKAKASKAKQAQSRVKALERMTLIAAAHIDVPFEFTFKIPEKNPNPLLHLENVTVSYGERNILDKINFVLSPQERIGIIGPNGAGKSTFIKLLAGELQATAGHVEKNKHCVIGYFAQHQMEQLIIHDSPLQHLQTLAPGISEQTARNFMGRFGFVGDMALQSIEPFSGGEKARLALALLIWQAPNLILLDEPTNHFDLDMRHALTLALQEFQGAVLLISHDRHLIRTTTDKLLLVFDQKIADFNGDIDDYPAWLAAQQKQRPQNAIAEKTNPQNSPQLPKDKASKNKIKNLELQLEKLGTLKKEIEGQLADPKLYEPANKSKLQALLHKQKECQQELEKVEGEWLQWTS